MDISWLSEQGEGQNTKLNNRWRIHLQSLQQGNGFLIQDAGGFPGFADGDPGVSGAVFLAGEQWRGDEISN